MNRTRTDSMRFRLSRRAALPFVLALLCGVLAWAPRAAAQAFQTAAEQAILVDAESGTVLFEKNADQPFSPASMAKLMTVEIVFHADEARPPQRRHRVRDLRERLAPGRRPGGRLVDVRRSSTAG